MTNNVPAAAHANRKEGRRHLIAGVIGMAMGILAWGSMAEVRVLERISNGAALIMVTLPAFLVAARLSGNVQAPNAVVLGIVVAVQWYAVTAVLQKVLDRGPSRAGGPLGDVLAVLGFVWPLITLATMLLYAHFHPPDPHAHWGSRPSEMRDVGSRVLAIGSIVAAIGLFASRRRTLRVLALIGVCVNFWLAASWFSTVY